MGQRSTLLLVIALFLAGCAKPEEVSAPSPSPAVVEGGPFGLFSRAFEDGEPIPREHTCDGAESSPPLVVEGAPPAALMLALIAGDQRRAAHVACPTNAAAFVVHPDAPFPQAPQRNVTHWLIWNIPVVAGRAPLRTAISSHCSRSTARWISPRARRASSSRPPSTGAWSP